MDHDIFELSKQDGIEENLNYSVMDKVVRDFSAKINDKKTALIKAVCLQKFGVEISEHNAKDISRVYFEDKPGNEFYYYKCPNELPDRYAAAHFIIEFYQTLPILESTDTKCTVGMEIKYRI